MKKVPNHPRILSRRETLKACLVPATAVLTGRLLAGCSDAADSGDTTTTVDDATNPTTSTTTSTSTSSAAGSGTAGKTGGVSAANSGSAGSTAGAQAAAGGGAASTGAASAGSQATASAGTSAAGSSGAAGATAGAAGSGTSGVAGPGVMWATGGTKTLAPTYPDPFETSPGTSCKLYPAQTLGPCYAEDPMMRSDISDGLDGLPTYISFLVVGEDGCTPVTDATVDIWHSGSQGIYSAYAMGTTCNPGNEDVLSDMFCRGAQAVNESGKCNFATVFPGWYRGRTLHIHFTIRVAGREVVTSQLYFEDDLVDEILAQGYYKARGMRDTTNQRDGIFASGGASPADVVMEHAKRPDGVLHLWKVLSIG
jgi:protocatechuate 3,4-dioxygenase beta subunit